MIRFLSSLLFGCSHPESNYRHMDGRLHLVCWACGWHQPVPRVEPREMSAQEDRR